MKRVIAILISTVMVLGLAACGNKTEPNTREEMPVADTAENNATETAENHVTDGSVDDNADETLAANETDEAAETTDDAESENAGVAQDNTDTQGTKVLVAYFSATNTTEGVAQQIVSGLNADIYEIIPEEPYTDADLDYHDNSSRTTIEMNDPDFRPAISGSVENMEQYDIVFIGYAGGIIGLNQEKPINQGFALV